MHINFKRITLFITLMFLPVFAQYTTTYSKNNTLQVFNNNPNKKNSINKQEKNINKTYNSETKPSDKDTKINLDNKQENNWVKKQPSRGGESLNEFEITLTFYTGLAIENGGFKEINCVGKKLSKGMVANNVLPLGTKIITNEFGTLTVSDRGGNNFDTIHRLDVYVPRNEGECDSDYFKRVNDLGRVTIKAYIVKPT